MTEVDKELELSKYIEEWSNIFYAEWKDFYYDVCQNRRNGIYLLKRGNELMDLLNTIMGNIENYFLLPNDNSHLIPTRFASVSHVVDSLKCFKELVCKAKPIIEKNVTNGVIDNYIISGIYGMVDKIEKVADRCEKIYGHGEMPRPYQILREKLFNKDIDGFVECINDVLKGVPYLSRKKKFNEGHFQTMLQLLLIVLGFEPIAEQTLSDGRIDMVIKLDTLIYIFEFKYTNGTKLGANKALQQIKDKGYANPYRLTAHEIIGVGCSFSGETKNINDHKAEQLL
ncbi:MAG: PD-(D/E)XK nuclease domain-containing protein [Muribaculaceae bacterium]|nr:PD-(D/E)XK nuclease domain-containing protein [Muribaculaceae bacterium]